MRTIAEIVDKLRSLNDDFLDFKRMELVCFLPLDHLREFLKPDADMSDWEPDALEESVVKQRIGDYMSFAWDKVRNHRGISAIRSIDKTWSWLWLLEDTELCAFAEDDSNYAQYGAPILAAICRQYGLAIPPGEEIERMIRGLPCRPGCEEGCGR